MMPTSSSKRVHVDLRCLTVTAAPENDAIDGEMYKAFARRTGQLCGSLVVASEVIHAVGLY